MSKVLTYDELQRLLVNVGFAMTRIRGSHTVFRHATTGAMILLPMKRSGSKVERVHVLGVRRMVIDNGLTNDSQLHALLKRLERSQE